MPLIDDETKVLLKVTNLVDNNFSDTGLIDNPEEFFGGDTPIIRIEPTLTLNSLHFRQYIPLTSLILPHTS